jgi:hypothetical protein
MDELFIAIGFKTFYTGISFSGHQKKLTGL